MQYVLEFIVFMQKSNREDFIARANWVHGNIYDYSKVQYNGVDVKVEIICPFHGSFYQIPYSHTKGIGCAICGQEKAAASRLYTKDEIIQKIKEIHGETYQYLDIPETIRIIDNIEIICKKHGKFIQKFNNICEIMAVLNADMIILDCAKEIRKKKLYKNL